jgi:hypothetical protein
MPLISHQSRGAANALFRGCPGALLLCLALVSCVDKEKCEEAVRVTRDSLAKEQPAIARQWRERAWKICNDATTTATLDKEIVDKEAEIAKKGADLQKQIADSAQQRMRTAGTVWRGYDDLDEKQHTVAHLDLYREKAAHMSQGLPAEYAKQIDDYNQREYDRRRRAAK